MELLVVIGIAAILAAIAIPSLQNTLQMNHLDTAGNQFVAALSMLRSEAVKADQSMPVVMNGGTYPTSGSYGAYAWTGGWQVGCAPGTSISGTPNPCAPVQIAPALNGTMTLYGSYQVIGFNALGRLLVNGVPTSNGANFIFCVNNDPTKSMGVTISPNGRVRIADTDKTTGYPLEDSSTANATTMSCQRP